MDGPRFDHLTKSFAPSPSRRSLLTGVLGALGALFSHVVVTPEATAKPPNQRRRPKRRFRADGPCGDGGPKANACTRHRDCCTRYCDKRRGRGRCRCRKRGQSCTRDRNCCRRGGQSLTCQDGTCQPAICSRRRNDVAVCASYAQGDVRCCDGACPPQPDCVASGTPCPEPQTDCAADCCSGRSTSTSGEWFCLAHAAHNRSISHCVTDRDCAEGRCHCGTCCFYPDAEIYGPESMCARCCSGACADYDEFAEVGWCA